MDKLKPEVFRYKITNIDALPTLPRTLKHLLKLLEKPNVSLTEIGEFVSNDPVIAAKVLKMVNSAIYGFSGRISSVKQAVILLGMNVVKGMLLGISIFELMQETMVGLWEHSIGCSVAARIIAQKRGFKETEEISVSALLHDIGKVVLILQYPDRYEYAMKKTQDRGVVIGMAEEEVFPANHAEAGSWITEKWRFPKVLTETIRYHHKPHLSKTFLYEASIVSLADVLVRARGFGFAGDMLVPSVKSDVWERLEMTEADLRDIFREMEYSMADADMLAFE
mgnify:CR=1 FL=1